jgi:hypothetical protein
MAKFWVFLQISILTACSVVGTATHVGAKTGLTAPPQAEQEISPQLIGLPLSTLDDFVRAARRGAGNMDELIRQSDDAVRAASNARNLTRVRTGLRNLKFLKRPSNVRNGRLNRILNDMYKSQYCEDILTCGVILERTLDKALTDPSYIKRAKDLETALKNLIEEGVLKDPYDRRVADEVRQDITNALAS